MIAAQLHHHEVGVLVLKRGHVVSAGCNLSSPLDQVLVLLESAQILGKGARGPNPTGMSMLTFGVQVVEGAVDVETGTVRVERVAAELHVGRNITPIVPLRHVVGGIILGIAQRL